MAPDAEPGTGCADENRPAHSAPPLRFAAAAPGDAAAIAGLVRRAYASTTAWTSEAKLVEHDRIDSAGVLAKIIDPAIVVLIARDTAEQIVACCTVTCRSGATPEFGLFAVEPKLQAIGLGRHVLREAERIARHRLGATSLRLRVLSARSELIAWYERRGYTATGRTIPFAVVAPDDHSGMSFVELVKKLR